MAYLFPIQTATAQTSGGTATLNLSSAPTPGNNLFLIVSGFYGPNTPPSGFNLVQANVSDNSYNASWVYSKVVQSGDGQSYNFVSGGDVRMCLLVEVSSAISNVVINHGPCSLSGNTMSTGSLAGYPGDSNHYRLVLWEWDNRVAQFSSLSYQFDLILTPTTFTDSTYANHASLITGGTASASGPVSLTLTASPNYPIWMDIVLVATGPAIVGRLATLNTYASGGTNNQASFSQAPTAGNLLLACCMQAGGGSPTISGYTLVSNQNVGGGGNPLNISILSKIASAGELQNPTFGNLYNDGGSSTTHFALLECSGAASTLNNPANSTNVFNTGGRSGTVTFPALGTAANNSIRIAFTGWNVTGQYFNWSPLIVLPKSDINLSMAASNSAVSISGDVAIVPMELAGASLNVSLSSGTFGSTATPSRTCMVLLDILSPAASGGFVNVIWLM